MLIYCTAFLQVDGAVALELAREDWLVLETGMTGLQAAKLIAELKRQEREFHPEWVRGEL